MIFYIPTHLGQNKIDNILKWFFFIPMLLKLMLLKFVPKNSIKNKSVT